MTSFYMFRLLFLTFNGKFRGTHEQEHHLHESPLVMTAPLMVLAILSMVGGLLGLPAVLSHSNAIGDFLAPLFETAKQANPALFEAGHPDHNTEWMLMGVSVVVALVSASMAFVMYGSGKNVPEDDTVKRGFFPTLIYHKYYVDELYDNLFVKPLNAFAEYFCAVFEYLIIDLVVNGVGFLATGGGKALRRLQSGAISFYLLLMVISIVLILFVNLLVLAN
jgi:NADH-quinone oxidoreductase subunit L